MSSPAPASSPAHFRVTLSGFPGVMITGAFSQQSGGNKSAEVRRYHEGGELDREEVAGGPATRDDLTVGRPFRRDRDVALGRWADRNISKARGTITKQPLDEQGNAYGQPIVYSDCLLTGCTWPDHDADAGGDTARIELTFAVGGDVA